MVMTDRVGDLRDSTNNTHQRAEDLLSFINNITMDLNGRTTKKKHSSKPFTNIRTVFLPLLMSHSPQKKRNQTIDQFCLHRYHADGEPVFTE